MRLLISDANILIDMEEGELLEPMFRLPFDFCVPDILYHEELQERHSHLPEMGLNVAPLEPESMSDAANLIARYSRPSRNDCFALALARQENCPLLTGDRELVRAAENENVPANGTIWLVEQMIHEKVITIEQAAAAYSRMEARARRLPWEKARKRLEAMASRGE